ncbi:MAG: hypothetical protein U9R14_00105 [Patescibacteria group bacterium]|nr:hypothetical protein [Patescibacteria group bacterium]
MKKLGTIFVIMVLALLIDVNVFADEVKNNYLSLRYETGRNTETGDKFHGTYNVFENNSLKDWALGVRFITGEKGFKLIIPCAYYKVGKGFQLGAQYSSDSFNNESVGPSFRFIRPVGKIFVFLNATQYFDTKDDKYKTDIFLSLKTLGQGWYCGAEFWYYNIKNGTENLHFRPIRIGYRFKNNLAPFVMLQRKWNDQGLRADSILAGIEIKF